MAGSDPLPAAGTAVAVTGALAAALAGKVARRSPQASAGTANAASTAIDPAAIADEADRLRAHLQPVITGDAAAYAAVLTTQRKGDALRAASAGPATVANASYQIAELAATLTEHGNRNLRYDAEAAARLAACASQVAASLATANTDDDNARTAVREAARAADAAEQARAARAERSRP